MLVYGNVHLSAAAYGCQMLDPLGVAVTGSCELPDMGGGNQPRPSEGQDMFLIVEPSLQAPLGLKF